MGRSPCCEKAHTNKGAWTREEDTLLISYIRAHGEGCWRSLPKAAGLQRCGKSCRLRWINYLRPDLKRGNFSEEEDQIILKLHSQFGNKWSLIASHLPGRTDNEIKNYWNTHVKRKLANGGEVPRSCQVVVGNAAEHVTCCSGGGTGTPETPTSMASGSSSNPSQADVSLNLDLSISLPWNAYDAAAAAAAAASLEAAATGQDEEEGEKVGLLGGYVGFERVGEGCNLCGSSLSYPPPFRCYI